MAVMSIGETDPHPRPLTVEDLERMPEDGNRYELVDGRLEVSPSPTSPHSLIDTRLSHVLTGWAPEEFIVLSGPGVNFNADHTHHRIPDLAVIRDEDYEAPYLTRPPLLAVEIVSPSSVFRDHHTKRVEYAKFGIESYWIISPDAEEPGVLELRLKDGQYREASQVFGEAEFETDAPFPAAFVPHWLMAPDRSWRRHVYGAPAAGA
ncbi:Uma2 family endonuclease [Streptomonospora alba]|nr:Uma2 family endonuclease [Streptomonospora alba]